jgi:hypothetical protein
MFIYILFFSLFIKYLAGATSRAGTAYPSGAPEFTQGFSGVNAIQKSLKITNCKSQEYRQSQWPKVKAKEQPMIYKTLHRKLKIEHH